MITLGNLPIFDIDLGAPPEERWAEVAEARADEIHALLEDIQDLQEEHGLLGKMLSKIVPNVAAVLGAEYTRELRGIANAINADFDLLVTGNLMYDIGQVLNFGISAFGCSSYSCSLPDGGPMILARNLDWSVPEGVGEHTIVLCFHKGRKKYYSVGIDGFVGVLSAVAPGRWAVTVNQAPIKTSLSNILKMPALMQVRWACDESLDFRQLRRNLKANDTSSAFFAHVVGMRPDEHGVFSFSGGGQCDWRKGKIGQVLIQTNHELEDEDDWSEDDEGYIPWSIERAQALERSLKRRPSSMTGAMKKLKRTPVFNSETIQSMILCPADAEKSLISWY